MARIAYETYIRCRVFLFLAKPLYAALGVGACIHIHLIYLFSQLIDSSATKSSAPANTFVVRLLFALWKKKAERKLQWLDWFSVCGVCSMFSSWINWPAISYTLFPKKEITFVHCQKHNAWWIDSDFPRKRTYQLTTKNVMAIIDGHNPTAEMGNGRLGTRTMTANMWTVWAERAHAIASSKFFHLTWA